MLTHFSWVVLFGPLPGNRGPTGQTEKVARQLRGGELQLSRMGGKGPTRTCRGQRAPRYKGVVRGKEVDGLS